MYFPTLIAGRPFLSILFEPGVDDPLSDGPGVKQSIRWQESLWQGPGFCHVIISGLSTRVSKFKQGFLNIAIKKQKPTKKPFKLRFNVSKKKNE